MPPQKIGVFRRLLTLIPLRKHRDTNRRHAVIQISGVFCYFLLFGKKRAYFCKTITIEMGGVSQFFSEVSGSGVDFTPLSSKGGG